MPQKQLKQYLHQFWILVGEGLTLTHSYQLFQNFMLPQHDIQARQKSKNYIIKLEFNVCTAYLAFVLMHLNKKVNRGKKEIYTFYFLYGAWDLFEVIKMVVSIIYVNVKGMILYNIYIYIYSLWVSCY